MSPWQLTFDVTMTLWHTAFFKWIPWKRNWNKDTSAAWCTDSFLEGTYTIIGIKISRGRNATTSKRSSNSIIEVSTESDILLLFFCWVASSALSRHENSLATSESLRLSFFRSRPRSPSLSCCLSTMPLYTGPLYCLKFSAAAAACTKRSRVMCLHQHIIYLVCLPLMCCTCLVSSKNNSCKKLVFYVHSCI